MAVRNQSGIDIVELMNNDEDLLINNFWSGKVGTLMRLNSDPINKNPKRLVSSIS